ncbi:MAG: two-component system, NarL family, sensor histidine kinase DegS, partial [Chloroflexota bacterium]|nr:two-component system, NarL family, sensor histidine kinase DegS [Chloroflexota bacterium]
RGGGSEDRTAALGVVGGMTNLTDHQRDMLSTRIAAVLDRAMARPSVVRGAEARAPVVPVATRTALGRAGRSADAEAVTAEPTRVAARAEVEAPPRPEPEVEMLRSEDAVPAPAGPPGEVPALGGNGGATVTGPLTAEPPWVRASRRQAPPPPPAPQAHGTSAVASVLHALVMKCLEQVKAELCQVFLLEDDTMGLRAEAPAEGGTVTGPRSLSVHSGFSRQVRVADGAIALDEDTELVGTETIWLDRGMRHLAAVAVGNDGEPGSGLLVVGRTEGRPFSAAELDTLAQLAAEVTLAMASADLLSRAEELAVLKERMKLAREIHDGLASDLSAVVALFKYHEHRRRVDPGDADTLLLQMRELVEESLESARDILATLRPRQQIPKRLADAVRRHVEDFSQTYGITAITRILGEDDELDDEERDAIYQVLREALTNVRKHSEAGTIHITLDLRHRPYGVVIEDDGVGIDLEALEDKAGSFGLLGMRERAELLGGSVEISNGSMGGARIAFQGPSVALGRG